MNTVYKYDFKNCLRNFRLILWLFTRIYFLRSRQSRHVKYPIQAMFEGLIKYCNIN